MPKVERTAPPFMQIAQHLTTQIKEGALAPGVQLPSVTQLARDWQVATATAAKAIKQLQADGYVHSTSQGTFVSEDAPSPLVSFRPSDALREELDTLAAVEGRSREDVITEAVQAWVDRRQGQRQSS